MAGLDNIKKYADGGTVAVTAPRVAGEPTVTGKVPLDPTETASILSGMQQMLDERTGPMAQFMGGLKDAAAWTAGGAQGPSEALNQRAIVKNAEDKELMGIRSQMATYRSAAAQNEIAKQQLEGLLKGTSTIPGAAGTASQHAALMNDPDVQLRMSALPAWDHQGRLDILADAAKTNYGNKSKGAYEAAGNKPEPYPIPGVGPGGRVGMVTMTPNEYLEFKATGKLPDGRVIAQGQVAAPQVGSAQAPSAATGNQVTGDAAARVAGSESGANPNIGYHDLSKSSAYGTYGITKAAYQDIQATNPKFKDRAITSLTPAEQTEAFNTYRQLSGNRLSQLGVETNAQNLDLAHFLGADGAARFLKTGTISDAAANANGGREKAIAIAQSLLGGKPVSIAPAATNQTAPLPPHPSTIAPVKPIGAANSPAVSEWDDNTKMLPKNEWDDNTRMLPGQATPAPAAPAAPAPAPAPAASLSPISSAQAALAPAQVQTEPMPQLSNFGDMASYNAAVDAWKTRQAKRAEGIGTESTKTAEQDTNKKNEYRDSLDTTQKTFDQYDRLLNTSKGNSNAFNLAGGFVGSAAAKVTPVLSSDPSEHHAIARTWFSNSPLYTHFKNIDQGAAEAQAAWAKNLVQGAGGRLTNADLQLGKPAKGVGVETTYESHMANLAKNMQDIRTAYYRAAEFQKWEKQHPEGTAAQFELTPYYQTYSKVDAARDVAKKFLDVPEVIGSGNDKYIHKDKNGKPYVVVNGEGYPL